MKSIAFIDSEIEPTTLKILDIGGIKENESGFHSNSLTDFIEFLKGTEFICGHNLFNHDLKYLQHAVTEAGINSAHFIDTLFLSPLLFPMKPYHALLKDDKLQTDELNNPLVDSIKARDLFFDEITAFYKADEEIQQVFYLLLKDRIEFLAFFRFISYACPQTDVEKLIRERFSQKICERVDLNWIIEKYPIELAYCLALINSNDRYSITPRWVLKNYPKVEQIMHQLRNNPCLPGCPYCNEVFDIYKGLEKYFGYKSYRTFDGEPLQEQAVSAALANKSILAVFPTGGGKSISFQVPALINGHTAKGLTVVISPLQSLMKDQVDNLEKAGITEAVTINGALDPIERAKSFERVEDGSASILYISPESLRSKSIERLLLGRKIVRFVIDEAHCFSSWGQDFRIDYLYIADFIKQLQDKKNLEDSIPVSCFTATAKPKVIEDIRDYFNTKLRIDLTLFTSKVSRTNLHYTVFEKNGEEEKYQILRDLIEDNLCPTIIYVSRTRKAYALAEKLTKDGFDAKPYHGKMDVKEKAENQDDFISGKVRIMVATSAFGMGVDKKDVGMVIHYDISDSLENYIQEAGRAGRDEQISAECYVLFNEDDLDKHFILLNQTKLSIKEIQQVWKAIKEVTKFRSTASNSALEIARMAGWDENIKEIETRVTTAIAALEDAGYLKRGQNMPRIFATSILSKNAQDAIDKISVSSRFNESQRQNGIRIIKKLISSKSKHQSTDEVAESRVDYISDHLGIAREEVIKVVNLLREEKILADTKDLTAFIKRGERSNQSKIIFESYAKIENFLLRAIDVEDKSFHMKELNEAANEYGCVDVTTTKIKTIINFWAIKNWIKRHYHGSLRDHFEIQTLLPVDNLKSKLLKRQELAKFIIELLYEKSQLVVADEDQKAEVLIEFSVHELKEEFQRKLQLFEVKATIEDIEDTLFYLSRINAIKIDGGFLVVYNRLTVERLEQDNKKRYKAEDYQKLNEFYDNKIQQIHIVGEYAKKMISEYEDALQFVEDYFHLNYSSFLNKYFKGNRQGEIKKTVTPAKFRQLFGELSLSQLKIINDQKANYIFVAAGPGSGKTRILVHKLASLVMMEDVKYEQLLMLTFSRAAATEFKKRLIQLIGNAANYIEIKTFHSFCFDLLGKVGTLEKSDEILRKTIDRIRTGEVETNRITKTVLVIDEAQDIDSEEFELIKVLIEKNEDLHVIAVGDDDQNIFEFRGASSKYIAQLMEEKSSVKYELLENYRSKSNLVDFSNQFAKRIKNRLKENPITAIQKDNGTIKIVSYQSNNLITPTVSDILSTPLAGTTCVLTKTNEEALQITGLLLKNGVHAKLIQANDGFNLFNLFEIRYFIDLLNRADDVFIISDDVWGSAKRALQNKFHKSTKLELCNTIIGDFESTNPKRKYKSDFEIFIRESKLEDFFRENTETIYVSTIHKAKGKEFENVFLMLENFYPEKDEAKRQLYVALTRTKQNLVIHLNGNYLDSLSAENLIRYNNTEIHLPPKEMLLQLTHEDVNLGYFEYVQHRLEDIYSGDILIKNDDGYANAKGKLVLKFSQKFKEVLNKNELAGFVLKEVKVNSIVFWRKPKVGDEEQIEFKVILPEVYFERF
jgi:ATP-dependent DNA helicase RecQ